MSCHTIQLNDMTATICHGAEHRVVKRQSEGAKWCFKCRTRQEFFYIVTAPTVPDYYGPSCDIKCGHCNTSDGDLFPGVERQWE